MHSMIAPGALGVPRGGSTRLPAEWGCSPPPSYQRAASASPALRSLSIAHCSAPILCIMHICWMCSSHLAPHTSRLAIPHPFCAPHCITNNFAQLPTTSITYCFPATTGFTAPAQPAAPRTSHLHSLEPCTSQLIMPISSTCHTGTCSFLSNKWW